MPLDWTASPARAYALKDNILFPGTAAQANALERAAEDSIEADMGLGTSVLADTLVITPAS